MKYFYPISDTFRPVTDDIDFDGPFDRAELLMSTATARIYRISRAGKRMLLKTPIDDSGRSLELLKREYALGVGLSHPNVAAIYTWEPASPVGPGILMEYVDGCTLGEFLAGNPSLSERRRVFEQLLDAVNYIHRHGVTHNDLKPGNIMLSRANGDVKLIDFGLSDSDSEAPHRRQLGGTPGYASPELTARATDADTRSDIYSLGVIMHDIFGHRYRRIRRRCTAPNPRCRYRNLDHLISTWRRRKKMPAILAALLAALLLTAIIALGILKIHRLGDEVDTYTIASRQMADTIAALNRQQLTSTDSIARLNLQLSATNLQLSAINRDKASTDSLARVYIAGSHRVIEKYKAITRSMRCVDEAYHMFEQFTADMDRSDSLFLSRNPVAGRDIYDRYAVSIRMQGTTEIEALTRQLPSLQDLTSDLDEQARLFPLIHSGQPWSLRSDSK